MIEYVCDVCGGEMEIFSDESYFCVDCGRHGRVLRNGKMEYDDEDDDWMGKDDIDWDDVFDD